MVCIWECGFLVYRWYAKHEGWDCSLSGRKRPRAPHFAPRYAILFFLTPLFFGRLFLVRRRQDRHVHGGRSQKQCSEKDSSIHEHFVGLRSFADRLGAPSQDESDLTASSCPWFEELVFWEPREKSRGALKARMPRESQERGVKPESKEFWKRAEKVPVCECVSWEKSRALCPTCLVSVCIHQVQPITRLLSFFFWRKTLSHPLPPTHRHHYWHFWRFSYL